MPSILRRVTGSVKATTGATNKATGEASDVSPEPASSQARPTAGMGGLTGLKKKLKLDPATNKRLKVRLGERQFNIPVPGTDNTKTNISFITTGGTISALGTAHTYTAGGVDADQLLAGVKPRNVRVNTHRLFDKGIDSKDMEQSHWLDMLGQLSAREIDGKALSDKIVMTHGTDAMSLTAFFLELTLPDNVYNSTKLVLTGSMLPSDPSIRHPDGPGNLKDALTLAKSNKGENGVFLQMDGKTLLPTQTDKRHRTSPAAFTEINETALGKVRGDKVTISNPKKPRLPSFDLSGVEWLPHIDVIYASPGSDPERTIEMIRAHAKKADGLVYVGSGGGTIHKDIQKVLGELAKKKLVVRTAMAGDGEVHRNGHAPDDMLGFACGGLLPSPGHVRVLAQVALAAELKRSQEGHLDFDMRNVKDAFDAYQSAEALASKPDSDVIMSDLNAQSKEMDNKIAQLREKVMADSDQPVEVPASKPPAI